MNDLLTGASVFGTGILELWAAIPLGFTLKLHPLLIGILSAAGSMLGAFIVIFFGTSIRNWLVQRTKKKGGRASGMTRIWDKYGIPGIGFLSPIITGAPLGAAIAISFGAEPRKLFLWMTIGIIFWSAILTTAAAFGLDAIISS